MSKDPGFTSEAWKIKNHKREQETDQPTMNRHDRRSRMKKARCLNRAIQRFARQVMAHSEVLQNIDKETPRSEFQKIFIREAKKLVRKRIVLVPTIMTQNGSIYRT